MFYFQCAFGGKFALNLDFKLPAMSITSKHKDRSPVKFLTLSKTWIFYVALEDNEEDDLQIFYDLTSVLFYHFTFIFNFEIQSFNNDASFA